MERLKSGKFKKNYLDSLNAHEIQLKLDLHSEK